MNLPQPGIKIKAFFTTTSFTYKNSIKSHLSNLFNLKINLTEKSSWIL